MKEKLKKIISNSLNTLVDNGELTDIDATIRVDYSKDHKHGDYASNIALLLAKKNSILANVLAAKIIQHIPKEDFINKIEIAGVGFINFFISKKASHSIIEDILDQKEKYGLSNYAKGKKILLEFVSANPTGPLHVGHGRGAAFGSTLKNLLTAIGYDVDCEYYVNDAGRQIDILTISIWLRYLEFSGESFDYPDNAYKGSYINLIANILKKKYGNEFYFHKDKFYKDIEDDGWQGGDKEKHIDDLITNCKQLLGTSSYEKIAKFGLDYILEKIKDDLDNFGTHYDNWYSEKNLINSNLEKESLEKLNSKNILYEDDGTLWFKTTKFGDEKDRVVVRKNGEPTYFASDISYHLDKLKRGYDKLINIWGADHHGYISRMKATVNALGYDENKLEILLVQFANLYRKGKKIPMSTRAGSFVTLAELCQEVGNDAARFFYVLRRSDQHLDFDLDLAKEKNSDNPVYYIQYAHARICSVYKQAEDKNLAVDISKADLGLLVSKHEQNIIKQLNKYKQVLQSAAEQYEPHQLAYYLKDLANIFHSYYNHTKLLINNDDLRNSRIALISSVKQIIKNGLEILGVKAPISM